MGRLTTTPGMWVVRGLGLWFVAGLIGTGAAAVADPGPADQVFASPTAVTVSAIGFAVFVVCLVLAAISWNWNLGPDRATETPLGAPPLVEPPRAATEEERYGSLYAAADDLDRRKASRRR